MNAKQHIRDRRGSVVLRIAGAILLVGAVLLVAGCGKKATENRGSVRSAVGAAAMPEPDRAGSAGEAGSPHPTSGGPDDPAAATAAAALRSAGRANGTSAANGVDADPGLRSPEQPGSAARSAERSDPGDPAEADRAAGLSPASPAADAADAVVDQRPEDAPLAPMGRVVGDSPLTRSPGYKPPNDPEADAVRTGRRRAPLIDIPFRGGESSPERLAQAILDGLRTRDFNALRALRVTPDEFADILWPEFPESRPICNSNVDDVYFFLDRHCHSGISVGLDAWGGQDLRLLGVTYAIGRAPYRNFTLYRGVHIHVLKPDGEQAVLQFACTFAERGGVWKVYAYKDRE